MKKRAVVNKITTCITDKIIYSEKQKLNFFETLKLKCFHDFLFEIVQASMTQKLILIHQFKSTTSSCEKINQNVIGFDIYTQRRRVDYQKYRCGCVFNLSNNKMKSIKSHFVTGSSKLCKIEISSANVSRNFLKDEKQIEEIFLHGKIACQCDTA